MAYVNLQQLAFEAFDHIDKKELKQAEFKLSYLLKVDPENPTILYYLGCMFLEKKQTGFAIIAYERALHFQPGFDECLNNLSTAYRTIGRIDKCIESFTKAIAIAKHPAYLKKCNNNEQRARFNLADYLGNLGSCYIAQGTPEKAIPYLDEAIKVAPERTNAFWNRGLAYLEQGKYEQGFVEYDYGDRVGPDKERSYHGGPMTTPVWEGPHLITETKPKETVVVYGEQGIGDEIMFASMLPDLMQDANVIFECHPRLMEMFRLNFPGIPIYGTRKSKQVNWAKNHKIDRKIAIGSLGKHYRSAKEDFPGAPYLKAAPNLLLMMKEKLQALSRRPKIGISWKGGIGVTNKGPRCIALDTLRPLFDFDVDFISLQYHSNAQAELDVFHEKHGATLITHWQDVIDDYDLTAGLLPNLDMVISVPQSVVHLAGALGVATIQMCPIKALWQMGPYGQNAPWYSCVENFWQKVDGNWDTVVKDVCLSLEREGYKCL